MTSLIHGDQSPETVTLVGHDRPGLPKGLWERRDWTLWLVACVRTVARGLDLIPGGARG